MRQRQCCRRVLPWWFVNFGGAIWGWPYQVRDTRETKSLVAKTLWVKDGKWMRTKGLTRVKSQIANGKRKIFSSLQKDVGPCPGPEALPFFHSGWHRSNLKFHYSQELTFSVKIKLIERMQFFAPLADSNKKLRILGGSWELRASS